MYVDWAELRKGLSETRQYVLSHHERSERYRCYSPIVFGRRIDVCARCSGIYPGIFAGVALHLTAPTTFSHVVLAGFLPLPALVDWAATSFTAKRGYNVVRTTTGALLGYGYGLGIAALLSVHAIWILMLGVLYALTAGILVTIHRTVYDGGF